MNERITNEDRDLISLAWTIYLQQDHIPQHLVREHMEILDFYLDLFPEHVTEILDLLSQNERND